MVTGSVTITNSFNIIPATLQFSGTGIGQPATTATVSSSANPSVFGPGGDVIGQYHTCCGQWNADGFGHV